MVDPSVHRFHMSLSGRDESSGGSDFEPARKESSSSVHEGTARPQTHKSRSRTRRTSVDRAVRTSSSQKDRDLKNAITIENTSKGESSSASSSTSRASSSSQSTASSSSSSSKQSSSDNESVQSLPISNGKSLPDKHTEIFGSDNESMASSAGPTSRGKSIPDNQSATSCSEDEPMQASPGPISKGKSIHDKHIEIFGSDNESMPSSPRPTSRGKSMLENQSATSCSEDESMQALPEPTSKGKSIPDKHTGIFGSEDESMQASPGQISKGKSSPEPTSKGKSIPDKHTAIFGSEDESMQASPGQTPKGKSISDKHTGIFGSEDKSMKSSPEPTSKGKSIPDNQSATSGSKDESIKSSPKPNSRGKSFSNDNESATSGSENESSKQNKNKQSELLELEDISSTPISEDSPDENMFGNDKESALPEINTEANNDQHKKELGEKLTVKFKVTIPEVGNELIGGPLQFLRVPQFIPVESGAFDDQSFKDSMHPDDLKDEQARGDFLNRLKTTVRWRENQDKVKESNARIVRWSDGTETFHVGAEVFDVMHHKMIDNKNQLYVRLESCYQAQGSITDKMTLRPKLDSTFGQSHVQGLRNRAMNKPQTGVVKVISDLVADPMTDREQRVKADLAKLRKEERLKRREIQLSLRKPRVKPMRHCTADDSDMEQPTGEQEDLENESVLSAGTVGRNNTQGIRTNRNVAVIPGRLVSTDEEDDEDAYDSDVNDIINDEELDYYKDGDDEELSDEPRASTSKPKRGQRHSSKSDSDEGPKVRTVKRKTKRLVYSDSSSD